MGLPPDLVSICLVVKGFPPDTCPAQVGRQVSKATGISVEATSLIYEESDGVGRTGGGGWLLRFRGHNDQKTCLLNYRMLTVTDGSRSFPVKLEYPHLKLVPEKLDWISMTEEARMDSVKPEDMYGAGGEGGESGKGWGRAQDPPPHPEGHPSYPNMGYPQGYRQGYPQGHPQGYPQGHQTGHTQGHPQGHPQGYPPSHPPSHPQGHPPGHPPGHPQGHPQGHQQGHPSGHPQGHPQGHQTGHPQDYPQGHPQGYPQGHPQGYPDYPAFAQYPHPGAMPSPPPSCSSHGSSPSLSTLGVDPRSDAGADHAPGSTGLEAPPQWPSAPGPPFLYGTQHMRQAGPHSPAGPPGGDDDSQTQPPRVGGGPHAGPTRGLGAADFRFEPPQLRQGRQGYPQPDHAQPALQDTDYMSDFGVLDPSREEDRRPPAPDAYLKVTELPPSLTEAALREFFQSRRESGGGPVADLKYHAATNSASVVFLDVDDVDRVIQRAPLLLKGKKVCVEWASREDQAAEVRTVEVRGLQSESDSEMCFYYFENPVKGGGEIESRDWNEEEKILLITFVDADVARSVASKGHTLGSKVLEVSLYMPPAEDWEEAPQCTILVQGFDPTKGDLYELYFSNPRRGGDAIVELRISEDGQNMYITFESPEVAERIAGKPHSAGGRELVVTLAPLHHPTPPSTIKVMGCDLSLPDLYRYYFENPIKGGGEISDFVVDEKEKALLITFCDPEVAQHLAGMSHKVRKANLNVTIYTPEEAPPPTPKRQPSQEPKEEEEEEEAPRMVLVTGGQQQQLESEDTYQLYFESPRHGGGEVEKVDVDEEKKLVYVTFKDPQVAARVAAMEHTYNHRPLAVSLYVPPKPRPTYPNKLLFRNVADSTTRDCLCMYLERVTGLEPREVLYGDQVGTVLVTFDQEPDLAGVVRSCQGRGLEGRQLAVAKVALSSCVLVDGLAPQTTTDTIQFYFENTRNAGGPVDLVEMVEGGTKCFVHFEDHEVLDGVLARAHRLDKHDLVVKRYLECLGQSGGSEDPTAFTLPKPITMDTMDPYKVAYLRQSKSASALFMQQLGQCHARGRFAGDHLTLECTLTPEVTKGRILARTWGVDVRQSVESLLGALEVRRRHVIQELWAEVEKSVTAEQFPSPKGAMLFPLPQESAFIVVGTKSMADDLFTKVASKVKAVEEELEIRKQQVKETNSKLQSHQLRLLQAMGFLQQAEKRYQNLKVEINVKKRLIVFQGSVREVAGVQGDMYQVLLSVARDTMPKLTPTQRRLLDTKEVRPHVVLSFKKQHIIAVWELDTVQDEIVVFAFDDKNLVQAVHLIEKSVPEHVCKLTAESTDLLHSSAWTKLVEKLRKANPEVLLITPESSQHQVRITCIDSVMHGVVETVEGFLQENSVYSQVVRFSPSRQLFVQQEWHQKLMTLQTTLKAHKVGIQMKESGTELYVRGTVRGLDQLRQRLQELNAAIVCHEERVTDVAKVQCLNSPHTDRDLKVLGQTKHCVLALKPEKADLEVEQAGSPDKPLMPLQNTGNMQTIASVELPGGVTIAAVQGDLTQVQVDVIVNAANDKMDHIGGLARDIVDKGGQTIQEESYRALKQKGGPLKEGDVLLTGGGRLACKAVVHAVGPVYQGGHSGEDDCLHDTVISCLTLAASAGHASIAMPAISTGIFRYPPKEATRVITEAVKAYVEARRRCPIRSVYLCHFTPQTAQMFADCIRRTFPSAHSLVNKPVPAPQPRPGGKGAGPSASIPTGQGVINVSIVQGEIAKQTADVIVNSTSNGLDLRSGAISGSILAVAGQRLQDECRQQYPTGISTGEMAQTLGHGLQCQHVYHLALCNWQNPNAQQTLGGYVVKCLTEASRGHHRSIAFPVLGTGALGYPPEVVADTMLSALAQFQQTTPSTSLRQAAFVVYTTDKENLKVFQKALKKLGLDGGGVKAPPPPPSATPTGNRQNRRFSLADKTQPKAAAARSNAAAGTSAIFEIEQVKLVIKQGDITEDDADAIVNSSNAKLDLSRGNVSSALKSKCGDPLVRECAGKVGDIQNRGITHTKAHNMKSRVIIHINSEKYSNDWTDAIKLCLQEAETLGVQTLAMPALGTGAYGQTPSQSASALFHTLVKVISEGGVHSVQELRVVLFDLKMIPQFVGAVEELGNKHSSSKGGLLNWFKSALSGSAPSVKQTYVDRQLKEAKLYIYAASQAEVPSILRAFDDLVKDRFVHKEVTDDVVLTLDHAEIEEIYMLRKEHKVEICIQQTRGRVLVDGLQNDVFDAVQKISKILRQVERDRQELQAASMLKNMVQWSYLEVTNTGTKSVEYGQRENQIIEVAFSGKKKRAELTDTDGTVYVVDFDSMMEYPKHKPHDTLAVLRQDKMKELASGSLPKAWEAHGAGEHIKMVTLQPGDQEFKDVEANLRATLGTDRNITVTAIARVQNQTLYQQYAAKKAHLEKQNQGIQNEKTLWHGTGSEAIENINNYGFNRSYCGKNATAYGQGVYFAVNSNYSTHPQYSPVDPSGKRHVYQCKVLAGYATTGTHNMRVLPARDGPVLYDSATNDLQKPVMYVVFNDTQAYPEYLVTFK